MVKWGLFLAKDLEPGMLIPEHGPNGMWMRNKEIVLVEILDQSKKYLRLTVRVRYTDGTWAQFRPEDRVQVQGSMVR